MAANPITRRLIGSILLLCLAVANLTACSSAPKSKVRGTNPYTVRGDKYYPLQTGEGYDETGMASWYGPGFHGKKTANGERYNQNALTAAHKLLPLGTVVKVTNLENDKSVVLRVNDRGPFKYDRIIDVSRRAAHKLDMHEQGTAKVRVEALSENGKKFSQVKKNVDTDIAHTAPTALPTPPAPHESDSNYEETAYEAAKVKKKRKTLF